MSEKPIDQQIQEQGEVVRRLKAAKEPKEKVCETIIFSNEKPWMKNCEFQRENDYLE